MARNIFRNDGGSGQRAQRNSLRRRRYAAGATRGRRPRFEELESRQMLAVLTVNSFADNTTANDNLVTLREAIIAANTDTATDLGDTGSGADVIKFDPTVFAAAQTIMVGTIGEISISGPLAIVGPGSDKLTLDGEGLSRIFQITAGDVSIKGLTLKNGAPGADGGAINSATLGMLNISDSVFLGNTAINGGAIMALGSVLLMNSRIGGTGVGEPNSAVLNGGGIFTMTGNVMLMNSEIIGNGAIFGNGGGIDATFGAVTLQNSTVDGNNASGPASHGGGINTTTVVVQNSTISNNTALKDGGGVDVVTAFIRNSTVFGNIGTTGQGGGVNATNVTLENATIAKNKSSIDGGGISVDLAGTLTARNSIIADNETTLVGSAFDDLRPPGGAAPVNTDVRSTLISDIIGIAAGAVGSQFEVKVVLKNAHDNFIGDSATATAIASLQTFGAGGAVLGDNGGVTLTVALAPLGIAIDAGNDAFVVSPGQGDQRGLPFARISPFGTSKVDMGAFELQKAALPNPSNPELTNPIADQSALVDNLFAFQFPANTFTDVDGDALSYTATLTGGGALPAWLTFNPASRSFTGTPTAADTGTISIHVTATDSKGGVVPSDDFTLTVSTDPPPVVANPIPDQTAGVNVPFTFTFAANTFTDPNNDPLTYSAALAGGGALPAWLTFTSGTRTFSGTPGAGDVGTIAIRVTANDGHGNIVSDDFNLTVVASELPFSENFEGVVDPRIKQKSPSFATTVTNPIAGTTSYEATRPTVGARPVATVDFALPTTPSNVTNVSVNVSTNGGNGSTLWSNAVIVFDYVSPTNYKFAGVFEIIDKLIIGQVVNGKVQYLQQKKFPAQANTTIPLSLAINHGSGLVTLSSTGTSLSYTYKSLGTGTVGVGTINANSRFDSLNIS